MYVSYHTSPPSTPPLCILHSLKAPLFIRNLWGVRLTKQLYIIGVGWSSKVRHEPEVASVWSCANQKPRRLCGGEAQSLTVLTTCVSLRIFTPWSPVYCSELPESLLCHLLGQHPPHSGFNGLILASSHHLEDPWTRRGEGRTASSQLMRHVFLFLFFHFDLLFIFGRTGSPSLLCTVFLQVRQVGPALQSPWMGFWFRWLPLLRGAGSRACGPQ